MAGKQSLLPKVAELDLHGRIMGTREVRQKQEVKCEIITWEGWYQASAKDLELKTTKAIIRAAVWSLGDQYPLHDLRVAIVRKGGRMSSHKATATIEANQLQVPLYFRKQSSLTVPGQEAGTVHPHAVNVEVAWPVSEEIRLKGD